MNLAEVIKKRRKTLNISQRDLAEMAGIGLATIKDIERGKGNLFLELWRCLGWKSNIRFVRRYDSLEYETSGCICE